MPLRNTIAQIALLAVALGGSQAMDAQYGAFGAALSPLPGQEESVFNIAEEGAPPPPPPPPSSGGSSFSAPPPPPSGGSFSAPPGGDFGGGQPPSGGSFGGPGGSTGGSFGGPGGQMGGPGGQQGGFGGPGGNQGGFGGPGGQQGGPGGFGGPGGQQGGFGGPGGNQGGFGGPGGQQGGPGGFGGPGGQQGGFGGPGGNQGGFGGHEGQQGGPGGEFGGQEGGPNDEQMEQQRQQFEERHNKECQKQLKQGATQMGRMIKQIENKVAQLKRQGVTPPADFTTAFEAVKAIIERMKNVTGCEDAQGIGEELPDAMQAIQEHMQKLEQLAFLPRIKKEITQMFNFIKRDWSRAQGRAQKVKGVDLSDILAEGGSIFARIEEMKNKAFACIDAVRGGGDTECIETDVFEAGEEGRDLEMELRENINAIMALVDAPRQFNMLKRDRKQFDRTVKELKRAKIDTAELEAAIAALDQALVNVQAALKVRPIDKEAMLDAFEAAEDARTNAFQLADTLRGVKAYGDAPDLFGQFNAPQINIPGL